MTEPKKKNPPVAAATGERKEKVNGKAAVKKAEPPRILTEAQKAEGAELGTVKGKPGPKPKLLPTKMRGPQTAMSMQGLELYAKVAASTAKSLQGSFLSTREAEVLRGRIAAAQKQIKDATSSPQEGFTINFTPNTLTCVQNGLQILGQQIRRTRDDEADLAISTASSEAKLKDLRELLREVGDQRDMFSKNTVDEKGAKGTDARQLSLTT